MLARRESITISWKGTIEEGRKGGRREGWGKGREGGWWDGGGGGREAGRMEGEGGRMEERKIGRDGAGWIWKGRKRGGRKADGREGEEG